jgi:hypothetical protein
MNLNRRLATLERGFITEPTMLTMPDGSTVSINGPGDYLLQLGGVAVDGESISPQQAAHLDLIRRCTGSKEPGGGHMVDLIRALLLDPVGGACESARPCRRTTKMD